MTQTEAPATSPSRRLQFSLSSMALWISVACLAVALFMTNRKLRETERELATLRPLAVEEVARQFVAQTTLHPIATKVRDVRYSPEKNAYRVAFSWTDSTTKQEWSTDVTLESDGFGAYYGVIRNGEFVQPLGHKDGYTVAVKSPSTLAK